MHRLTAEAPEVRPNRLDDLVIVEGPSWLQEEMAQLLAEMARYEQVLVGAISSCSHGGRCSRWGRRRRRNDTPKASFSRQRVSWSQTSLVSCVEKSRKVPQLYVGGSTARPGDREGSVTDAGVDEPGVHTRSDLPDGSALLTIDALSSRLSTTHRHVRRLVAEKRVPYLKIGGLIRFDPAEIEDWLVTCRRSDAGDRNECPGLSRRAPHRSSPPPPSASTA
jgi:excisionase family DNA binding protein